MPTVILAAGMLGEGESPGVAEQTEQNEIPFKRPFAVVSTPPSFPKLLISCTPLSSYSQHSLLHAAPQPLNSPTNVVSVAHIADSFRSFTFLVR